MIARPLQSMECRVTFPVKKVLSRSEHSYDFASATANGLQTLALFVKVSDIERNRCWTKSTCSFM